MWGRGSCGSGHGTSVDTDGVCATSFSSYVMLLAPALCPGFFVGADAQAEALWGDFSVFEKESVTRLECSFRFHSYVAVKSWGSAYFVSELPPLPREALEP